MQKRAERMRLRAHVIIALVFIVLFQEATHASDVKTYRNNRLGFEISYLDNWEQSQSPNNPAFFLKRKSITEPGTISINVANFTGNKDGFMREIEANMGQLIEKYRQRFPSAEILENGETYLGGFPAYFVTISYVLKSLNVEIDLVAMQIFCVKDNKIYLVNFETPLALFDKTFNEFQAILTTFIFR